MIDLHKLDKFRLKDREREFYGCTGDSASAARHGTRCARLVYILLCGYDDGEQRKVSTAAILRKLRSGVYAGGKR